MGMKKGDGMVNKILELRNKNVGIKEIARRLNVSKNTVKKYLKELPREELAAKNAGPYIKSLYTFFPVQIKSWEMFYGVMYESEKWVKVELVT